VIRTVPDTFSPHLAVRLLNADANVCFSFNADRAIFELVNKGFAKRFDFSRA
jgi:hypothetical protein